MNGKIVMSRLNVKSGPVREALISFAVFESQKGQACAAIESVTKKIIKNAFIRFM